MARKIMTRHLHVAFAALTRARRIESSLAHVAMDPVQYVADRWKIVSFVVPELIADQDNFTSTYIEYEVISVRYFYQIKHI